MNLIKESDVADSFTKHLRGNCYKIKNSTYLRRLAHFQGNTIILLNAESQ